MRHVFIKIARRPRRFLAGWTAVVAVLLVLSTVYRGSPAVLAIGVLWVGASLGVLAAVRTRYPAVLMIRDGVFAMLADVRPVLATAQLTAMEAGFVWHEVDDWGRGHGADRANLAITVVLAAVGVLQWRVAWGSYGLVLRPDGIFDRQPLGSLLVPWAAAPRVDGLKAAGLVLAVERPGLLVRRGLSALGRRSRVTVSYSVEYGFLALLVNDYSTRPEHRAAIGTDPELRRVLAAYGPVAPQPSPGRGEAAGGTGAPAKTG